MDDVGSSIDASNTGMSALNIRNAQTDYILWKSYVVLQVVVGPLTMQREVGTFCYLLHRLLGTHCPLVEALRYQEIDAINEGLSLLAFQMAMIHPCTEFAYDVSCFIGIYLNMCIKASATASISDPGGQIMVSLQYLMKKLTHRRYMV